MHRKIAPRESFEEPLDFLGARAAELRPHLFEQRNLVLNMQTADGRPTFLKLKLTLELPDATMADTLDEDAPRLQDMFQTFLRELRPEDLSGSEGSYQLRMELLRRVNLIIAPAKVNTVLIEEMLIN